MKNNALKYIYKIGVLVCFQVTLLGQSHADCGDGIFQAGEECDDGNMTNDDGCSSDCTWDLDVSGCGTNSVSSCPAPPCDSNDPLASFSCGGVNAEAVQSYLGIFPGATNLICNGLSSPTDISDNPVEFYIIPNSVTPNCGTPLCGNGIIDSNEGCDDGATAAGDGCDMNCFVEDGYACDASDIDNAGPLGAGGAAACASGICDTTLTAVGICGPFTGCLDTVVGSGLDQGCSLSTPICDDGVANDGDGSVGVCTIAPDEKIIMILTGASKELPNCSSTSFINIYGLGLVLIALYRRYT